jgi:hypothetical protein
VLLKKTDPMIKNIPVIQKGRKGKKIRQRMPAPAKKGRPKTAQTGKGKIAEKDEFVTISKLPQYYGETSITAMMRDPYWIYCYWELAPDKKKASNARVILRVYDITGIEFNGTNAHSFFDIEISNTSGSRHIELREPSRTYCVEIGTKSAKRYRCLTRSGPVTTPRAGMSKTIDPNWPISDENFKKVYALSGGDITGMANSLGLQDYISSRNIPGDKK